MTKNDDVRYEIESIMNELNNGANESAATSVSLKHRHQASTSKLLMRLVFQFWRKQLLMIVIAVAVILIAAFWYSYKINQPTKTTEITNFIEQVHELATLATAKAQVKTVIKKADNQIFGKEISINIPGTKREILLIVPATVIAGVDLKGINEKNIHLNEDEKTIELSLPHATFIEEPAIDMDQVIVFSDEGLFRSEVDWAEGFDLAAEAQKAIEAEAMEMDLLQTAEKSAEKVLTEFFGSLGYNVKITYN